jgi:hypothetical protein
MRIGVVRDPPTFGRTCKKCGGSSERVMTFPKSLENEGYAVYQCVDCKFVEWLPQETR